MDGGDIASQRTFPKKVTAISGFRNEKRKGRYKKRRQNYIKSHNRGSDFNSGDAQVEGLRRAKISKPVVAKRRLFNFEEDVENESQESVVVEEDESAEWVSRQNDNLDKWVPLRPDNDQENGSNEGKMQSVCKKESTIVNGNGDAQLSEIQLDNDNEHCTARRSASPDGSAERLQNVTSNSEEAYSDYMAFREEIANIPLGKAKEIQGRLGIKLFNKVFCGNDSAQNSSNKLTRKTFSRDNPKRPREVSSKVPVSGFRNVFENEKLQRPISDPRFDDRCGEFNDFIYRNNYEFLKGIRQREKKILTEELKKQKRMGGDQVERLKEALRKMKNQENTQADVDRRKEIIRQIRHENNERMRQGLPPVFKTRAQIRQLQQEKKFEELKKKNKLDKYLRRKAKKLDKKGELSVSVSQLKSSDNYISSEIIK